MFIELDYSPYPRWLYAYNFTLARLRYEGVETDSLFVWLLAFWSHHGIVILEIMLVILNALVQLFIMFVNACFICIFLPWHAVICIIVTGMRIYSG